MQPAKPGYMTYDEELAELYEYHYMSKSKGKANMKKSKEKEKEKENIDGNKRKRLQPGSDDSDEGGDEFRAIINNERPPPGTLVHVDGPPKKWRKIAKQEVLKVSIGQSDLPTVDPFKPFPNELVFAEAFGSGNHQKIPFYKQCPEDELAAVVRYAVSNKKKLNFAATQFPDASPHPQKRVEPNYTMSVPIQRNDLTDSKEDLGNLERIAEMEETLAQYMASEDAKPAWDAVGIDQPDLDTVRRGRVSSIKRWRLKKGSPDAPVNSDVRIRFQKNISSSMPSYILNDMRHHGKGCMPTTPDTICQGDMTTATFQYDQIWLRPTDRRAQPKPTLPFTWGSSAAAMEVSIWPDEDSQILLVD